VYNKRRGKDDYRNFAAPFDFPSGNSLQSHHTGLNQSTKMGSKEGDG
jgi:hypothetical protein